MPKWFFVIAIACLLTIPAAARHRTVIDANGNAGNVVSHKTGAAAQVGAAYASTFQAYIDDIEAHGGIVRNMGGIRRGHCSSSSMHPCGKALDVCQTGRGRVDPRCHLPSRHELARIAATHGLFEGGLWCNSDYGHAQVGESAAPCGRRHQDAPTTMVASARTRMTRSHRYVALAPAPVDRLTAAY